MKCFAQLTMIFDQLLTVGPNTPDQLLIPIVGVGVVSTTTPHRVTHITGMNYAMVMSSFWWPFSRGAGYKFGSGNSGWREYDYYDNDRQYSKYHSMEREGGIPSYRSGTSCVRILVAILFWCCPDYHDNDNHAVRMRGLPFSASERDIANFFAPLAPLRITIERDSFGRPSGEGEVLFSSHDNAVSAMSKDRSHIGK